METLLAILIGVLFGAGIFCLLRRSVVKLVLGILLLSQAANLVMFSSGGLERGQPPLITAEAKALPEGASDPLPQALVLTAIVIGFGVVAFALVLVHRAYHELGTDDVHAFDTTERDPK
jgi:multicomponent Na+:H+ antiporter subunit C